MAEEDRDDRLMRAMDKLEMQLFWMTGVLVVIALLLAAIVFGWAEVTVSPA